MGSEESIRGEVSRPVAGVLTFLFADVRGYTRFTAEHGDEAAARLAARFAAIAREAIAGSGGEVYELVGDQAVAVFTSSRQAMRAAVGLQQRMAEERTADPSFPVTIGIGLDAGEAVPVEGGYRGGPLNLAARLCARAAAGEIFASAGVIHLARVVADIDVRDRGFASFKGMAEPVRVVQVGAAGTLPESLPPLETPTRSTNLAPQLTSFIGRVEEQARVKDLLGFTPEEWSEPGFWKTRVHPHDLAFALTVKNTGDAQEVQVRVTLTIQKSPQSIVKRGTIDLIDPGQTKTLTFADLGQPPFGVKTTVKVDVQPVPGEKTTSNNSAEYPVIFSLG